MAATEGTRERPLAHPERRHWADFTAIVAGVASFSFAIWGGPLGIHDIGTGEARNITLILLSYAIGGGLAVAGVIVAQQRIGLGRVLLAVGALVTLAGAFGFGRAIGPMWYNIVPAILMLASAPFLGPMPDLERATPPADRASAPPRAH